MVRALVSSQSCLILFLSLLKTSLTIFSLISNQPPNQGLQTIYIYIYIYMHILDGGVNKAL